jgi:hypothetical protein
MGLAMNGGQRREPYNRAGLPRVVRVHPDSGAPLVYGPFPTADAALQFVEQQQLTDYHLDVVYPPGDARPTEKENPA